MYRTMFGAVLIFLSFCANAQWNDDYEYYWQKVTLPIESGMLSLYDEQLMELRKETSILSDEFFNKEIFAQYESYKPKHLKSAKAYVLARYSEKEIAEIVSFLKTESGSKFIQTAFDSSPFEKDLSQLIESFYNKVMSKLDSHL